MSHPLTLALADARRTQTRIAALAPHEVPADAQTAYAIQHELLQHMDAQIGGWKIGAKSDTGPVQGAPLPAGGLLASGARVARNATLPCGIELEVAFRFGRTFEPRAEPYDDADVLAGIGAMAATVEIVASRFAGWPDVDRLAQLADLQNHGALIVGESVAYRADFSFVTPSVQVRFDGRGVFDGAPANPAGDPRRLLAWLVNHCTQQRGLAVTPDWIVTTGSYTGMFFPPGGGVLTAQIDGLAPLQLTLE
ncbi:2-keto-4-pentenoate hydratase [Paraburkholderia flava]|uniref:2-keto-4-pentenoate hydratase n=1 Tax=Paraburkholderia flava TaxID=2547393 RepID=UPI00105BDE0D|nr:2-keto-4-pentenoate hydratase [Paraburkholderia flava]